MNRPTRQRTILFTVAFTIVLAIQGVAAAPPQTPNPVLAFTGQQHVEVNGKQLIRYWYEVANKDQYPAEMFAPAPDLPPCGQNTKSSRTWVEIYDQRGKYLYGYCALTKPEEMNRLAFTLESDTVPPSWVYVEINDRKTGKKYKSNLAETTQ